MCGTVSKPPRGRPFRTHSRSAHLRGALGILLLTDVALGAIGPGASAQVTEPPPFRTERLGEKVLLLTETSPMENIVVALATDMGLVVLDATGSPYTAGLLRDVIREAFGRADFTYIVQTHYHWDHAWGNRAFPEAKIVAHEGARAILEVDAPRLPEIRARRSQNLADLEGSLAALAQGDPERGALEQDRDFLDRNVRGMGEGFEIREPDITFSDRMTLDLGDLTLELTFFGRAHSGNDVLIQIPEEGLLLTGDLFLDVGWLPLFAGQPTLDVPRWIEVLERALDGEDGVSRVIPGHREVWSREKLDLWRRYIVDLWEGVSLAKKEGATLEEVLARFPLEERFLYLKELGHTNEALADFQRGNVEAFWRQLSGNGAPEPKTVTRFRTRF